ncbi:MAG: hypothetical protein H6568_13465 [Lewinellaceae bacterium]|nr:hypothetical protein [Saprospiraceae bacterium]MCB9313763.1 hypothetical protein [Lewinellaceae bacterium]
MSDIRNNLCANARLSNRPGNEAIAIGGPAHQPPVLPVALVDGRHPLTGAFVEGLNTDHITQSTVEAEIH